MRNVVTLKYSKNGVFLRKVRSFVFRNRKLSRNKHDFFNKFWPKFGINFQLSYINANNFFTVNNPIVLEIGFGMGFSLCRTALNCSSKNFLGVEVYPPGVISCLKYIHMYNLKNIRIIYYDAVEVLNSMICDKSIFKVQIFFPDPWLKRRHRKRRIFTRYFAELVLKKLVPNGGILHISTDCQSYAEEILSIIGSIDEYINLSKHSNYIVKPDSRPVTHFEKRGRSLGNTIFDLMFIVR
ncbi:MAG: tRNA (guanosine(46)-N7)-methyltransferase TrmB [Buchnera aphidicola (Meitanaphis flavogallis)]